VGYNCTPSGSLSIDDFGTGYSSLSLMRRLPIDSFKIDRSFVGLRATDEDNTEIVRAIINLGKSLKKVIIAEGVESVAQLESLRRLGCDQGQGYLFSEPLSAEAAGQLAARYREWKAFDLSVFASDISEAASSSKAGPLDQLD
jgi:EAL domain-containing protein (putative c-di-GMP-specific phosphodiesterase class I)